MKRFPRIGGRLSNLKPSRSRFFAPSDDRGRGKRGMPVIEGVDPVRGNLGVERADGSMCEQQALLWRDRQRDLNGGVSQTDGALVRMPTVGRGVAPRRWGIAGEEPKRVARAKHGLVHTKQRRKDHLHR